LGKGKEKPKKKLKKKGALKKSPYKFNLAKKVRKPKGKLSFF